MKIYGLDFTSAPSRKKTITCARCRLDGDTLHLEAFDTLESFLAFESFLAQPGSWVAGIDFPFGQPRKFIKNHSWPQTWDGYVNHIAGMSKDDFGLLLKTYQDKRLKGDKQHLRWTDTLAKSKSPMMWYGVPVGKMFYEGAHRLLNSGASILPCHPQNDSRVILEAYPGIVARRWIENRSYKSDTRRKQTPENQAAREDIVHSLRSSDAKSYYGFVINFDTWADEFIQDGSGDKLDALLCAIQAGWAYSQREQNYGIPTDCDPIEGWIVDPLLFNKTESRNS